MSQFRCFVNPGHDVNLDSGAVNNRLGLRECDMALSIGTHVTSFLSEAGANVSMWQDDDLNAVIARANDLRCDCFLSIHLNAFDTFATGTEVLCYSDQSAGGKLAVCVYNQLFGTMSRLDPDWHGRGVKARPDLAVLRDTSMAACLAEVAFIDHDHDAILVRDNIGVVAAAISRGVTDYWNYCVSTLTFGS